MAAVVPLTSSILRRIPPYDAFRCRRRPCRHYFSGGGRGTVQTTQLVWRPSTSRAPVTPLSISTCLGSARPHRYGGSRQFASGAPGDLPTQFLEASHESKFDPSTRQRNDVPFDPIDGRPPRPRSGGSASGGSASPPAMPSRGFSREWMDSQSVRWRADSNDWDCAWPSASANVGAATKRILWSDWSEDAVRDPSVSPILFEYEDLVGNGETSQNEREGRILKALYQFGLVLITGTPSSTDTLPRDVMSDATKNTLNDSDGDETAESAILRLASMIGYHPLHTLYGSGVWSTSLHSSFYADDGGECDGGSSASTADSAYGSTSLPLHTDMTYLSTPPGVQVFLMVQPATAKRSGAIGGDGAITPAGQSVFLDGFAAARQLLIENPDAYRTLATTQRRYRCVDDDVGWHLEATGPVIETAVPRGAREWGPVKCIRHNDLDRLPDLPPYGDADVTGAAKASFGRRGDTFYNELQEAHEAWDDILRRDSMRLVMALRPGDCVLVLNQRCMHGRYAFDASEFPRIVMGCYVGMDELSSKWRKCGLRVL